MDVFPRFKEQLKPLGLAGLMDGLGALMGFDQGVFGMIVGTMLLVLAVIILASFHVNDKAMMLVVIALVGMNVYLGLWPPLMLVMEAVFGAALLIMAIFGGHGSSSAGPE